MTIDRLQFALTVTFHYLFPVLTMGLALFVFVLKTVFAPARTGRARAARSECAATTSIRS